MHASAMPAVSALFSGPVSVGLLAGVVSGLFYLVVAGIRWAGEVKQQSGEWLYRQVQRRLHPAAAAGTLCRTDNGAGMEPEAFRVREFIERLVESLVSGELDNVCVKRLHTHPEYDRMFACHHAPLCEALARLSFALQMAIANKHMADHDSPSAAHAALKKLVHQIIQEAMTLPKFKGVRPTEDDMKTLEDIDSKTYEDILATAILNKVIERYQQSDSTSRALDGNSNLLTPELMSLVALHQPKFLSNAESDESHHRHSDEGRFFTSDGDSLSDLSNTDPLSVTIEECIEEVTEFSNAEEEEGEEGIDSNSYLPGLDVFKNRRARFPEYGRDIIDGPPLDLSDDEDNEDEGASEDEASMQPTDIINPVDSWEENWLFQKRRLKVGGVAQPMPVPMLVPNPSEDYRALIGDRDAEDVSDLSDCSDGALEDLVLAENDITIESTAIGTSSATDTHGRKEKEGSVVNNYEKLSQGVDKSANETKTCIVLGGLDNTESILQDSDNELPEEPAETKNTEYLKSTPEDCLSEFGQQEGEYTEDYAAVTRRQMDSLTGMSDPDTADIPELPSTPIPQLSPETSADESVVAILDGIVPGESDTDQITSTSLVGVELAIPPRPGTIAEREHKKWETAPPLPNNPYSSENIIKRLNRKHSYNRTNSNSDASVEFPELKEEAVGEKVTEQPLQVICSPNDVDYKRYGRDYYINALPITNGKTKQASSTSASQQQEWVKDDAVPSALATHAPSKEEVEPSEIQDASNIESKVALWQKEINDADQYYKNILNKKQEQVQDSPSDEQNHQPDSSSFFKSMLNNGNDNYSSNENKYIRTKNRNKLRDKLKEIEKMEKNGIEANEGKTVLLTQPKHDHKANKVDNNFETYGMLRKSSNLGSSFSINENGNDSYTNGYSRSDSPSGSSVLTSDSDYSMPSVRELTKRFSGLVDSDSSTSTPKSVSPAPQSRRKEPQLMQRQKDEAKEEPEQNESSSPPRPVREIHSLTARSISKEFREELRHNQPVVLNKNVYKQINPKHINTMNNGIDEESTSGNTSLSSVPKSPVPHRSMQSSIAFWEKMHKNKS